MKVGSRGSFRFGFENRETVTGAVGMWESRQRFPRARWESEGNLFLVFLAFSIRPVISAALRDLILRWRSRALPGSCRKQLFFGALHLDG